MAIAGIIVSGEGLDSSFGGWCFMILGQSQGVMAAGIIIIVCFWGRVGKGWW